jgi:sodium transport system permease protein
MRWSIIRLIWLRELRDQLRDRRTVLMVAGLPLLLYPILGVAVLKFALGFVDRKTTIGIVTEAGKPHDFPPRHGVSPTRRGRDRAGPAPMGLSPLPPLAWLLAVPPSPTATGVDRLAGAAALAHFSHVSLDYPLLIHNDKFSALYLQPVADMPTTPFGEGKLHIKWLEANPRAALDNKMVDVLLSAPADFWANLDNGQPALTVEYRNNDEGSRLAAQRMQFVLARWKRHIKEVRFVRKQLPAQFDNPFSIREPDAEDRSAGSRNVLDMLVRIFPFMLVMWSLAGALYPAVDLCAGEKERGTMETLLISPASRQEIVWGKFLTIWVFSAGTALLNLLSMGMTTWWFSSQLPRVDITVSGLVWCVLLLLPLSAFFSAVCLSIGAYARSSKEGQYYLMPLFLATMPLIFLTLAPGVELNSLYCMVPVTGVALLMQRFLTSAPFEQPWFYFASVMAPIALYSWLALRWAIDQFNREEVLFREAERLDLHLWLRRLWREKETRPTTGQALVCFALLLLLRWFSENLGAELHLLVVTCIKVVAFLVAPPVFMALLLTTRPRQVLAVRWPAWPYLAAAGLLLPLVEYLASLANTFPRLLRLLHERQTLVEQAFQVDSEPGWVSWSLVLLLAFLTAAGKEIAFRGFIFSGLLYRMRPWPAILVASFLFAAFHMNVFLLPPLFIFGIALGVLALRSGSLLPGIVLHAGAYTLLIVSSQGDSAPWSTGWPGDAIRTAVMFACTLAATWLLWWQNRHSGSGLITALLAVPTPLIPPAPGSDRAVAESTTRPDGSS